VAFDFPNAPVTGQTFEPAGGTTYTWDGTMWRVNIASDGSGGGGGGGGTPAWDDITGKPATFPPTVPIAWADVSGKPATYPPTLPITEGDVTNLTTDLAAKAPLASPVFVGDPKAPTPATGDSDTSIATTAFVKAQAYLTDAPNDGLLYGRRSAVWDEMVALSYGSVQNYMFNAGTVPPPAAGGIRFNNPSQHLVTIIYLNYTTNDTIAVNLKTYFVQRVNVGDTFYIQDKDTPTKWQLFRLNAAPVDNSTYAAMPVTWLAGGTDLTAARVVVSREGASVSSPVSDAPNDGKPYVRKSLGWDDFTDDMAAKVTGVNTAKITVASTAPGSPATGDLWVDTT
jgi:hypothetical protein